MANKLLIWRQKQSFTSTSITRSHPLNILLNIHQTAFKLRTRTSSTISKVLDRMVNRNNNGWMPLKKFQGLNLCRDETWIFYSGYNVPPDPFSNSTLLNIQCCTLTFVLLSHTFKIRKDDRDFCFVLNIFYSQLHMNGIEQQAIPWFVKPILIKKLKHFVYCFMKQYLIIGESNYRCDHRLSNKPWYYLYVPLVSMNFRTMASARTSLCIMCLTKSSTVIKSLQK
jgi:hypothetical protein